MRAVKGRKSAESAQRKRKRPEQTPHWTQSKQIEKRGAVQTWTISPFRYMPGPSAASMGKSIAPIAISRATDHAGFRPASAIRPTILPVSRELMHAYAQPHEVNGSMIRTIEN